VVNGIADVFVVDITSLNLGSGENISFVGDAGDYFVLNVSGDVDMNGDATIAALSQTSHVLLNLYSAASLGNVTHVGNLINGTTLIPYATYAEFHSVNGAIYSGDGEIKLMSGATVTGIPFERTIQDTPIPEPASLLLLGSGLAFIGRHKLRRRRNSAPASGEAR
jgi:hypothetical protein